MPEGFVAEWIDCVRTADWFLNHPMGRRAELGADTEVPFKDPWADAPPWPGMRIFREVPSGRQLTGYIFKYDLEVSPGLLRHRPFEGLHPANEWRRNGYGRWVGFDVTHAYEHATLMGVVHGIAEGEAMREQYDERMARPRGRLRAPQVLSPEDEEALRDLR